MSSMLPVDRTVWERGSQIQDPLAAKFGVRMIVIDRPGCGGTGQVPLEERIERSCGAV